MPDSLAAAKCDLHDLLRDATERFSWFKTVAASAEVAKATKQFAKPSGIGRARGRIALERAFAPVGTLQAIGDGRLPYLLWAVIRPRPETNSVAVNFAAVLSFADARVSIVSMNWSANVAQSALADALRSGETDLDGLLMEVHRALLDAPASVVGTLGSIAVPAGSGFFVGQFMRAMAGNEPCIIFNAERWSAVPSTEAEPIGAAAEGGASLASWWMDPTRIAGAKFG